MLNSLLSKSTVQPALKKADNSAAVKLLLGEVILPELERQLPYEMAAFKIGEEMTVQGCEFAGAIVCGLAIASGVIKLRGNN
jgi:hypothetical protein